MHLTRYQLDRIAATQPASVATMRDVPGWGPVADAYEQFGFYRERVAVWSERQAEDKRDQLRDMRRRAESARDSVAGEAARLVTMLGLDPGKHTIDAIEAVWPAVLDLADQEQRELDLLGSSDLASRGAAQLRGHGINVDDPPTAHPVAETARQVRAGLLQARHHQGEVDEWDSKVAAVDPYEIDAKIVGWWSEWGRVQRPNDPNARPMLDGRVLETIRGAGIDIDGDRHDEAATR